MTRGGIGCSKEDGGCIRRGPSKGLTKSLILRSRSAHWYLRQRCTENWMTCTRSQKLSHLGRKSGTRGCKSITPLSKPLGLSSQTLTTAAPVASSHLP
eukprot:99532-Rhodomonas_salina.1